MLEDGFGNIGGWNGDLLATIHIGDRTAINRFLHCTVQMLAVAIEKTLAVDLAFFLLFNRRSMTWVI